MSLSLRRDEYQSSEEQGVQRQDGQSDSVTPRKLEEMIQSCTKMDMVMPFSVVFRKKSVTSLTYLFGNY